MASRGCIALAVSGCGFPVVLTRYSFHHFLNPAAVLAEMLRVCKPGGKVMVIDVVQPPKRQRPTTSWKNYATHPCSALTSSEMAAIIVASGLSNVKTARYKVEGELEKQLGASFPNPGDADKSERCSKLTLNWIGLGIDVHRYGNEIHFAGPESHHAG